MPPSPRLVSRAVEREAVGRSGAPSGMPREGREGSALETAEGMPLVGRNLRDDQRALAGRAVDREAPAERGEAVLESADARAARDIITALAVVGDLDPQHRARLRRTDRRLARTRILRDV